jgi:hypothetical protein
MMMHSVYGEKEVLMRSSFAEVHCEGTLPMDQATLQLETFSKFFLSKIRSSFSRWMDPPSGQHWRARWELGRLKKGLYFSIITTKPKILINHEIQLFRRFPIVAGFRVEWDSRRPSGQRVLSVKLPQELQDHDHDGTHSEDGSVSGTQTPVPTNMVDVSKEPGGPQYNVVTRLYMAQGFDGYEAFKECKYLVDEENGRIMSDLVRHYLLGKSVQLLKSIPSSEYFHLLRSSIYQYNEVSRGG